MIDNEFFSLDKLKNLFKNKKERKIERLEIKGIRNIKKNKNSTDLKKQEGGKFIISIELVPAHEYNLYIYIILLFNKIKNFLCI